MKKSLPYIFLALLVFTAILIRQCRSGNRLTDNEKARREQTDTSRIRPENRTDNEKGNLDIFRNPDAAYFFTKHARCRMKCRHITQEEVKEIVQKADVNYHKSEIGAPRGPKYALEGFTSRDRQHIRIIVAPRQRHLTIVTVIDLDQEWECPSCK